MIELATESLVVCALMAACINCIMYVMRFSDEILQKRANDKRMENVLMFVGNAANKMMPQSKPTYTTRLNPKLMQGSVLAWSKHNFKDQEEINPAMGAVEEMGELMHAILKERQGIRNPKNDEGSWDDDIKDAVGDVVVYLMDYCGRRGIDFWDAVELTWIEVSQRDWIKFPKNGLTE